MVSQKYRGSCIGVALAKWLAKNTVASQKMALEEKMEDGALEMLLFCLLRNYLPERAAARSAFLVSWRRADRLMGNLILIP